MSGAHRADPVMRLDAPTVTAAAGIDSAAAMRHLGGLLGGIVRAGDLIVLTGDLGVGKTTLAQGIGLRMMVRGDVTSPTFVIARVHPSLVGGPALVHVDAYRLETLAEVDDLDLDASLGESVTVVECGEGRLEGLAADRLQIQLARRPGAAGPDDPQVEGDEPRTVLLRGFGPRWAGVALPLG